MAIATKQLLKILDSLGESTLFCTAGKLTPTLPGLEVEGWGTSEFQYRPRMRNG